MRYKLFFIIFALSVLPHAYETPAWVFLIAIPISIHAYFALTGRIKKMTLRLSGLLSVCAMLLIIAKYKTLLGPEPATSLLIILAALKLEELRTLRDGVIYLLLSALLVMYYLLFSQTIISTLYMVAMCLIIMLGFIFSNTPREHVRTILTSAPKLVTKDLLLSLPLLIFMFAIFPRFSLPWGYKMAGDKFVVGFSTSLEPGQMASLAQSDDPAFRAIFTNGHIPQQNELYWRGATLVHTDGWKWQVRKSPGLIESSSGDETWYQIQLEPKYLRHLFVLEGTASIKWSDTQFGNPIQFTEDNIFRSKYPIINRIAYQGYKSKSPPVEQRFDGYTDEKLNEFLNMPEPSPEITALLMTLRTSDPSAQVSQILNYFSESKFKYSMNTPKMDTLDDFLFNHKLGFCEHYAAATAALLRWLNIPARVIVGFQGGSYNSFGDFYLVKDRNAHSWVEAFINNHWVRVDPTTAVDSSRISLGELQLDLAGTGEFLKSNPVLLAWAKTQMFYAALEQKYNQFLLNYNYDAQDSLFSFNLDHRLKRWVLFGACILGMIIMFLFYLRLTNSKPKTDYFETLLTNIRRDMTRLNVIPKKSDPISRMMTSTADRYPSAAPQFLEIKEIYLNLRFDSDAANKTSGKNSRIHEKLGAKLLYQKWKTTIKNLTIIDKGSTQSTIENGRK